MKVGVIVFPGSCDDQDTYHALSQVAGVQPEYIWHKNKSLTGFDAVVLPGGFSYGDYIRAGVLAARSPIIAPIQQFATDGGLVLGICNGFQILCEADLLQGALYRNRSGRFICDPIQTVRVERSDTPWTSRYSVDSVLRLPIKHGEGCYQAEPEVLRRLEANRQVVLRYCGTSGEVGGYANPNGSQNNIAGIVNSTGNVFGLMPHPEHAVELMLGSTDGIGFFQSMLGSLRALAYDLKCELEQSEGNATTSLPS